MKHQPKVDEVWRFKNGKKELIFKITMVLNDTVHAEVIEIITQNLTDSGIMRQVGDCFGISILDETRYYEWSKYSNKKELTQNAFDLLEKMLYETKQFELK